MPQLLNWLKHWMRNLLCLLLRAYQLLISPWLGPRCRFYPTCSHYAISALQRHGLAKGSILSAKRLCKCHPWHAGGIDPVPEISTSVQVSSTRSSSQL